MGVCLHRVGAGSVLLTDGDEDAILNCRHNLSINGVLTEDHSGAQTAMAEVRVVHQHIFSRDTLEFRSSCMLSIKDRHDLV